MATQLVQNDYDRQSIAWGEVILGRAQPYHSPAQRNQRDWAAVRAIDTVTVCEDPQHWKSLVVRSMRGDRIAYRQLLEEFAICLELFFSRMLPDNAALVAIGDTLQSVGAKLDTCDIRRPILPWLLAIATYRAENPSMEFRHH